MNETVWCANPDHKDYGTRQVKAVARLEFPSGRFKSTTACRGDLNDILREALDEGWPVLVQPISSLTPGEGE